ncbi:hypothetical protein CMK18_04530 [Candidatus Poribacteria bacterium]|nr:hypothetical protein [Candidatus Poribacteria bacterium]
MVLDMPDKLYKDYHCATNGIEIMNECSETTFPWFLGVGFNLPHLPFAVPKKYWNLYDRDMIKINPIQQKPKETPFFIWQNSWELRRYSDVPDNGPIPTELQRKLIHSYLASVSFIDEQVGRLIDHLQSFGQTENTVICLWGIMVGTW